MAQPMIPLKIREMSWLEVREKFIPRDMVNVLHDEFKHYWGNYYLTLFQTGPHSFIFIVDADYNRHIMSGISFMKKKYAHLGSRNVEDITFDDIKINENLTLHLRSSNQYGTRKSYPRCR